MHMRSRSLLAAILVSLAIVITLVVRPPIAFAATYTVHSCETPTGTFTGDGGWTSDASLPMQGQTPGAATGCDEQGDSLLLQLGSPLLSVPPAGSVTWNFSAPFATYISSLSLRRRLELAWPVAPPRYGRPYVYDVWHDGDEADNQLEFELAPYGDDAGGAEYAPSLDVDRVHWDSVNVRLSCWSLVGSGDCGPYPAQVTISRAAVGLTDTQAPAGFVTGGELAMTDPVRGSGGLALHATDDGAGVYRVFLRVDGHEVVRRVLQDPDGSCVDVEPSNDDPYEFGTPRPCPLSADGSVQLDTAMLRDGQHTVHATVEDAGGNQTVVFDGIVQTHNALINTIAPTLVGQPGVGGQLTANAGQWDGAPSGYDHRWLRCEADGSDCEPVAGVSGPGYPLSDADAYHRMVVEVTAANGSGTSTARSAPSSLVADSAGRTVPPSGQAGASSGSGGTGPAPGPGGIQGIVNPLAQVPGHVGNGGNATTRAHVVAAFRRADGSTAHTIRARHGRRLAIVGRLTDASGAGIGDARVAAAWRIAGRGWVAHPGVSTGADGRFVYLLPRGPSRDVRFAYFPYSDSQAAELSDVVHVDVLAPLTIRADRRHVSGEHVVRLSGHVGGGSIPRSGLLVTLQGYQRGWGWRTFSTVRTDRRGNWTTRYHFRLSQGRFGFRALVPHQARFPFATSRSAGVFVVVS
jgi:hypothetical protein